MDHDDLRTAGETTGMCGLLGPRLLAVAALAAAIAMGGCNGPTTTVETQWINPGRSSAQTLDSMLVVAVTRDANARKLFEDRMVTTLTARGVRAVRSYTLLPVEGSTTPAALKAAVDQAGVGAVLMTRVVNVQERVNVEPNDMIATGSGLSGNDFYGFYGGWQGSTMTVPGEVQVTASVHADTRVWDISDGVMAWTATSITTSGHRNLAAAIDEFVDTIVTTMAKDGLLPPPPAATTSR
jgi:hypothetical protein